MTELLAPAGDMSRLRTALHFGADAVYVGGRGFSLRAGANGFSDEEMELAASLVHAAGKKLYAAVNVYARDDDFDTLDDYLKMLARAGVDALIVSDAGIIARTRQLLPDMQLHLSTQANTTNRYAAAFWASVGVNRIVTARETTLEGIKRIRDYLPPQVEIESFVHGAMCISYSGRCLLSDYLTGRGANRGECVQACRWEYKLSAGEGNPLTIGQEERGSYILNSEDMCMLPHLADLAAAGVESFKIEGRMKTQYYVASAVSAYRAGIDAMNASQPLPSYAQEEVYKHSHRRYCTGFYYGEKGRVCYETSKPDASYDFVGMVRGRSGDNLLVEQRGRFRAGETLETLAADPAYTNRTFTVNEMYDSCGNVVTDAKKVCEVLSVRCDIPLSEGDILRRKR